MNLLDAIILGLVEGITEYLPVSSTGHLILTSALLGLDDPARKSAVDAFNIVVQGGAILAVLGLYRTRVLQMLRGILGKDRAGLSLALKLFVAFLPAALLGPLLDDTIEAHLFRPLPVLAALLLGGIWMLWLGRRAKNDDADEPTLDLTDIPWRTAIAVGCFQLVAMWPGTSRSMMTIAGGTLLGMKPKQAAEFSFLLGLPTLGGACVYKLGKNLLHANETGEPNLFEALGWMPVVLGIAVATIAAALAVRWLVAFLNKHGLAAFGWYRVALTIVLGALLATGTVVLG